MKKLLVLFFILALLAGCNNNPLGRNDRKADEKTEKKDRNDGYDDNDTRSNWTNRQRNKWMDDCIDESGNSPNAKEVCSCVLEKLERKYPDVNDAENASAAVGTRLAKECMADLAGNNENDNYYKRTDRDDTNNDYNRGDSWTTLQHQQFVEECATAAQRSQGFTTEQANSYCDCMTRKVEQKYSFQEASRLTPADFQTEEWQNAAAKCRSRY